MTPLAKRLAAVAAATILVGAGALLFTLRTARRTHTRAVPKAGPRGIDAGGRTPAESRAIAEALAALPKEAKRLRVAEDADAVSSDLHRDLENLYGEYHAFFSRGDLDGDGRLDFAQGFVEQGTSGSWFHVAVFFGRPDGTFQVVWVEKSISLADGDISIERSLLIVTPDLALDEARRWRFDLEEHRFVDADEDPGSDSTDEDGPDDSPGGRPQVRA